MAELTGHAPAHEVVIAPRRGWLHLDWHAVWDYRDLLRLLVRRDLLARYQQTLLGPLWHLLQPVLTTAVFVLVFARVARIPTGGVPAPLFYLSGLLAWNYFAQNVTVASGTFLNNAALFGKVWFPRLVVPLAAISANLVTLALQLVPFFLCALWFGMKGNTGLDLLSWRLAVLPLAAGHVALLSLGVGLCLAATTARYRDLLHLNQFLVQLWMFATPIIYPLAQISPRWSWLAWLNPMAAPVEVFRWSLLGTGHVPLALLGTSLGLTVVLLFAGLLAFENAARSAVDTV
jgi:lipopolysaccharide transport system permease protein